MNWREAVEWVVILLIIVSWWPRIFFGYGYGYDPMWYHVLTHYLGPLILIFIVLRRWRRMQEGFRYSEEMLKHQQPARPEGKGDKGQGKDSGKPSLPFMPPSDEDSDSR